MKIVKKVPFLSFLTQMIVNQNTTQYKGIEIIGSSANSQKEFDTNFEENVIAALQLIETYFPNLFERVQKNIKIILESYKPISEDMYVIKTQKVYINRFIQYKDQQFMQIYYAGLFIHAATHACLINKFSDYYVEDKFKIEDICSATKNRFYKKMDMIFSEYDGMLFESFNRKDT